MNHLDIERLQRIAAQLDRLRHVPTDVLAEVVVRDGRCMQITTGEEPPESASADPDRQLAADLCTGCTVQDACLELEFRLHGGRTLGVWGAMPDQDRRALYPIWLAHRQHGPTSNEEVTGDDGAIDTR
ncbi:WhiB family transcriptional regulator [Saccharopolyspora sp. ID03-671]|uniref:WhiB family transcriptional regulator n=1 Tax=Saccharopolyspora sp. ID03-671 TaxID=3073066 RepID=UPI00324B9758